MSKQLINSDFVLPILVSQDSARQNYVFDLIFKQLLQINYQLVDSSYKGKVLSYGSKTSDFHIGHHSILSETDIKNQELKYVTYDSYEFPFAISDKESLFPFDLFAVCFYCVTRYEEYINPILDSHGRFKAENSWQFQKGLLQIPIVNYLAEALRQKIESYFDITLSIKKVYSIKPTIDIDNAYAFHNRANNLFKSKLKSILKLDFHTFKLKSKAKNNKTKDPFNTHKKLRSLFCSYHSTVFFLMKSGGQDSTNKIESSVQQELIKKYKKAGFEIGIHPSYNSIENKTVSTELEYLRNITPSVKSSRYHFIKNKLPQAYNGLVKKGIQNEYSMGYATTSGFRAGICNSYEWFDLTMNTKSGLTIYPFYFMDATFIFNSDKTPKEALQEVKTITEEVKKYEGENYFVFHNESLSNHGIYKGWGNFATQVIDTVK